jgi:hypothetical protein
MAARMPRCADNPAGFKSTGDADDFFEIQRMKAAVLLSGDLTEELLLIYFGPDSVLGRLTALGVALGLGGHM